MLGHQKTGVMTVPFQKVKTLFQILWIGIYGWVRHPSGLTKKRFTIQATGES